MSEIKIPQSLLNVIADVNINEINSHIYTNESLTNWLCAWREEIKRELYDFANNHELYQQGISDERPKAFAKGYDSGYQQGRADAIEEFIELFDETWETDTSESWVTFVHQLADKVKKGE